jgi:hypothetical protein
MVVPEEAQAKNGDHQHAADDSAKCAQDHSDQGADTRFSGFAPFASAEEFEQEGAKDRPEDESGKAEEEADDRANDRARHSTPGGSQFPCTEQTAKEIEHQ